MATPRRLVLGAAAVAGVVAGAAWTTTLTTERSGPAAAEPAVVQATTSTTSPPLATAAAPAAPTEPASQVLLVWTSGGLPPGLADVVQAIEGVTAVTVVRGDEAGMVASTDAAGQAVDQLHDGWRIPLDVLAVDPSTFPTFLGGAAATVAGLEPGEALLTTTSAVLRRLGPGATIELTGGTVTVVGVVDDRSAAGAELLVAAGDAVHLGVATERYLLIAYTGDRIALQDAIAATLHGRATRFRSPAETAWLRHGDAVQPAAVVKAAYGEFAVRDGPGRSVEIDPAWVAASIATEPVPILGEVTCHRDVLPVLRAAMTELEQAGLAHLVDPADFAGCFSPRRIAAGQPLSHHAWGVALDLNVDGNPRGSFSTQDPRLVEVLVRHGFTWGGDWLVPDPAHYELVPA